jgi:hypothetical protein
MALRSLSRWFCGCNALAAAGSSIALVFAPSVAGAQYVQYAVPPPPPPPPPPPYYYREFGGALDLRIIRQSQFGLHAEWVTIDAQPYAPEWVAMGAHVDLAL